MVRRPAFSRRRAAPSCQGQVCSPSGPPRTQPHGWPRCSPAFPATWSCVANDLRRSGVKPPFCSVRGPAGQTGHRGHGPPLGPRVWDGWGVLTRTPFEALGLLHVVSTRAEMSTVGAFLTRRAPEPGWLGQRVGQVWLPLSLSLGASSEHGGLREYTPPPTWCRASFVSEPADPLKGWPGTGRASLPLA